MHMQQVGAGARWGLLLGRAGREGSDTPGGTSREEAAPKRAAASIQRVWATPADTAREIQRTPKIRITLGTVSQEPTLSSSRVSSARECFAPDKRSPSLRSADPDASTHMVRGLVAFCLLACSHAFTLSSGRSLAGVHHSVAMNRHSAVAMGLFDGLKKAFDNEEFKEDDQRVRCRHILIKGDDDVER